MHFFHYIISGGHGDCINQIFKCLVHIKSHSININDAFVTYVRDEIDEKILDEAKPFTRGYDRWITEILKKNGLRSEVVCGNQKTMYENYYKTEHDLHGGDHLILLGPNLRYDVKIYEPQRELYIGIRPYETEMLPIFPVNFAYNKIEFKNKTVCLQVRFGDEYPTKIPNACWNDVQELLSVIKAIKNKNYDVVLIGETKKDISALDKITDFHINCDIGEAIDYILSSDIAMGFAVFFANVSLLSCKKTLRMFWDELEYKLQVHPEMEKYCISFNHNNVLEKIEEVLK